MSASRCYLDYNATAPLRPNARDTCTAALDVVGNPSSVHREGRAARALIETARREILAIAGPRFVDVVFTSGGTEAANLLLSPTLLSIRARSGTRRLLIGASEHPCVIKGHRFAAEAASFVPVDREGLTDLRRLEAMLNEDGGPAILALQAANNETGVIQPVREAAALVHAAGGILVCDAVQAAGRVDLDGLCGSADAIILSAHKLGGPKGAGAALLADGVTLGSPLIGGGGQERGRRSGTENVAGIAGFGAAAAAARAAMELEAAAQTGLRERLERALGEFADIRRFGAGALRLPNTSCFAIGGLAAETALMALDLAGVAVSSGSACSSGKVSRSHVLEAMGVPPELSACAIRVSVGWGSAEGDVDRLTETLAKLMRQTQRRPVAAAA